MTPRRPGDRRYRANDVFVGASCVLKLLVALRPGCRGSYAPSDYSPLPSRCSRIPAEILRLVPLPHVMHISPPWLAGNAEAQACLVIRGGRQSSYPSAASPLDVRAGAPRNSTSRKQDLDAVERSRNTFEVNEPMDIVASWYYYNPVHSISPPPLPTPCEFPQAPSSTPFRPSRWLNRPSK